MLTSAPRSSVLSVDIMITSAPRSVNILIICKLNTDNLRIVENVYIPFEITTDVVDGSVKSSTHALDEIFVHKESISDVKDTLVESTTTIPDDIDISDDDTSDFELMFQMMILMRF